MSKSDKKTQDTGQEPEKIVTKYELKMQRRKEQKEKELKDKRIGQITGIVLVALLACFVASFPIRNWLTVHGTYIKVNGDSVSKVEYDFNYNVAVNNYLSEMGYYLYYFFGIDITSDFSSQMYSDTLTWGDYFDQLTVERISQNKGLKQKAKEEGFAYDTADEYKEYVEQLKTTASEDGSSVRDYVKKLYGAYATESRVKPYIEEEMYVQAYANLVTERLTPSQDEIQEHYNNNQRDYDSVDYYLLVVNAELPTEPTELADPVENNAEGSEGGEGTDAASDGQTESYTPSEAEVEAAMKEAKEKAEKSEKTIETEGELHTNVRYASISSTVRDWLYEEGRAAGDTTVLENTSADCYYVVKYVDRYLDQTPSIDYRMVATTEGNGAAIYDEWKSGAATEDSFADICDKYNTSVNASGGGLVEGRVAAELSEGELKDWLFDSARTAGDTTVIAPEGEEYTYVLYYKGLDDPKWVLDIRNTLLNDKVSQYLSELINNADIDDPKGNLKFIKVLEDEAAAAQNGDEGTESDGNSSVG